MKKGEHLNLLINHALNEIKNHPTNKQAGKGAEPCTLSDLKLILESIPKKYLFREFVSSLFLFSIYTGSRGIACSSLCSNDIQNFSIEDNRYLLRLNLSELKGTSHQDHPVNFESSFSSNKNIDFIHWFSLLLMKNFNLDLVNFHNRKHTDEDKNLFIWPQISTHKTDKFLNKKCTAHEFTYYL